MSALRLRPITALTPAAVLALCLVPANGLRAETIEIKLRNGDTVHGKLIRDASSPDLTVIDHPQLGRLEISSADRLEESPANPWKSSLSAGIIGNQKDGDDSLTISLSGASTYKDMDQTLELRGSFNNARSRDGNGPLEMNTQKGSAGIRYDRSLNSSVEVFALSNYLFNGLNDSGVNTVLGNIGIAFPLIKNETSALRFSFGPSVQWSGGGQDCGSSSHCDRTYAGGTVTADLSWTPQKAFRFSLQNQFSVAWASPLLPANTFTAEVRFYPSINSGLFTSLQLQSIYQSMNTPEINNTVTAQIGADF